MSLNRWSKNKQIGIGKIKPRKNRKIHYLCKSCGYVTHIKPFRTINQPSAITCRCSETSYFIQ